MTLRPVSPVLSTMSDVSEAFSPEETSRRSPSDSSLLIKVTIRDGTVLAGRPTVAKEAVKKNRNFRRSRQISFAVVQVLSNALVIVAQKNASKWSRALESEEAKKWATESASTLRIMTQAGGKLDTGIPDMGDRIDVQPGATIMMARANKLSCVERVRKFPSVRLPAG